MESLLTKMVEKCAARLLPNAPDVMIDIVTGNRIHEKTEAKMIKGVYQLVENCFELCSKLPKQAIAFRSLRAVLVKSFGPAAFSKFDGFENKPDFGSSQRASGLVDFSTMALEKQDLTKKQRTVQRVDDDVIKNAVIDMLSTRNVSLYSWGQIRVKAPGDSILTVLPKTIRKRSIEEMWKKYSAQMIQMERTSGRKITRTSCKEIPMLHRSSYFGLAAAITGDQEKMIMSVDYVTDQLINEKMLVLRRIISDLVAPTAKDHCTDVIVKLQNFLKYNYDSHCIIEDDKVQYDAFSIFLFSDFIRFHHANLGFSTLLSRSVQHTVSYTGFLYRSIFWMLKREMLQRRAMVACLSSGLFKHFYQSMLKKLEQMSILRVLMTLLNL
jgi:hypothetical protein